jgi:hypothetical protein
MGEVVSFRRAVAGSRRAEPPGPEGAQILFFLGVRYERYEEAHAGRRPARKSPPRNGSARRGKQRA